MQSLKTVLNIFMSSRCISRCLLQPARLLCFEYLLVHAFQMADQFSGEVGIRTPRLGEARPAGGVLACRAVGRDKLHWPQCPAPAFLFPGPVSVTTFPPSCCVDLTNIQPLPLLYLFDPVPPLCSNCIAGTPALRRLYTGLYINMAFLSTRNIFRFVEFFQSTLLGWPTAPGTFVISDNQALFYSLDTLPILLCFLAFIVYHPGWYLPKIPQGSPQQVLQLLNQ